MADRGGEFSFPRELHITNIKGWHDHQDQRPLPLPLPLARPMVQVKQVILEEMRPMAVDTSRRVDLL